MIRVRTRAAGKMVSIAYKKDSLEADKGFSSDFSVRVRSPQWNSNRSDAAMEDS